MRTRSKLVLASLGATFLMALAIGTASARTFNISNQRFRATFANLEFTAGGSNTTCRVTLEGTLHETTIPKTIGILLGYITRVQTGECAGFAVRILTETLPWHVRYSGFSGTLPNITLIIIHARASFEVGPCLSGEIISGRLSRDPVSRELVLASIPTQVVPVTGLFCPVRTATFRSNGNGSTYLSAVGNTRISVTLI